MVYRQSGPGLPSYAEATSNPLLLQQRDAEDEAGAGRRACKRFTKAFVVAVLIYSLTAAYIGSFNLSNDLPTRNPHPSFEAHWEPLGKEWEIDINQGGCKNTWDVSNEQQGDISMEPDMDPSLPDGIKNAEYTLMQNSTLFLSPDATKILLVGNRTYGNVQFSTSSDANLKEIRVNIIAYALRMAAHSMPSICKLKSLKGGEGVGLYLPFERKGHEDHQVFFKVLVTFPTSLHKNSLRIKSLESQFSIFAHKFNVDPKDVHFDKLVVRTSEAAVKALSPVKAQTLDMKTANGDIRGSYQVKDSLVLETSNGKIEVDLEMTDSGKRNSGVESVLRTSNGEIYVNAELHSETRRAKQQVLREEKGGRFVIDAKSSNKAVVINVPNIPYESDMTVYGRTSNANLKVELDRKGSFEGTYKADTSNSEITVERADSDSHSRYLDIDFAGSSHASGKVYWDDWDSSKRGKVELISSNARINLNL